MSIPASASGKKSVDTARIGECGAQQPVSGTPSVGENFAVYGMGRGGFVQKTEKNKEENFRHPVNQGRA